MIIIGNEFLRVEIAERGAEIKSIISNGKEYVWSGDPDVWASSCPVLFPICGGLKNNKYIFEGREYHLPKHGFLRRKTFIVESFDSESAVFLFSGDDETKASYPFLYEIRIKYTLFEKTLNIDYNIKNTADTPMYFNIGSHEGYFTPEGIEEYDIVFEQNENLNHTVLDGNILTNETVPILNNTSVLPLSEEYFKEDALVFTDIKSRTVTLKDRRGTREIKVDYPDDKYLLFWHVPNAKFICIEPWNGIPDRPLSSYDITQKEGITKLDGNSQFKHTHSITIIK